MSSSGSPLNRNYFGDVTGLVAVVTGGGTGIGLMCAKTLVENGAKVYITGRRKDVLEEAAKSAPPGTIIPIQASVTDHDEMQKAVDIVTKDVGYIDVLINNAGKSTFETGPNARKKPTANSSVAEIRDYFFNYRPSSVFTECLELNVVAVLTTTMAFLELLDAGNKRRAKGLPSSQVITIGSAGGFSKANDSFIYNASKAGVHHMMKNLAAYLLPHNIRTNTIAPGYFESEMSIPVLSSFLPDPKVLPKALVPMERMGLPEEMGGTLIYLVSRAGGYCNGMVLPVEGGFLGSSPGTY